MTCRRHARMLVLCCVEQHHAIITIRIHILIVVITYVCTYTY